MLYSRLCIDVQPSGSSMLAVTNTHLNACGGGGLYLQNARATVSAVTVENSQYGVRVGPNGLATVKHSSARGGSMGFAAADDPFAVPAPRALTIRLPGRTIERSSSEQCRTRDRRRPRRV